LNQWSANQPAAELWRLKAVVAAHGPAPDVFNIEAPVKTAIAEVAT